MEGFDWNAETALQSGTFRNHDIRADMLAGLPCIRSAVSRGRLRSDSNQILPAVTSDGLYGSGMSEYANTNKVSGARVGTELSADLRWRIDQHLLLGAIAAEFLSGPAVQEAFGKTVTFFAAYRF